MIDVILNLPWRIPVVQIVASQFEHLCSGCDIAPCSLYEPTRVPFPIHLLQPSTGRSSVPRNSSLMTSKMDLPSPVPTSRSTRSRLPIVKLGGALVLVGATLSLGYYSTQLRDLHNHHLHQVPPHASEILAECAAMEILPGPPSWFASRLYSERFEAGTKSQWIKNATIWTGGDNGNEGQK